MYNFIGCTCLGPKKSFCASDRREELNLHAETLKFAPVRVAQPKIAPARVAQIMTSFLRKTLILHAKTPKFASARVTQIMTN